MSGFSHGLACVGIGGKYGDCNSWGELIVRAVCDVGRPHTDLGAVVKRDGVWGLIDTDGKLIQGIRDGQLDHVFSESEVLFRARAGRRAQAGYLGRNYRWAIPPEFVVDPSFRAIRDKKLTGAEPLRGGLVRIYTGAALIDEARMGYVDRVGNVVWEPSKQLYLIGGTPGFGREGGSCWPLANPVGRGCARAVTSRGENTFAAGCRLHPVGRSAKWRGEACLRPVYVPPS